MQINSHLSVLIHDLAKNGEISQRLPSESLVVTSGKRFHLISSR